MSIFTWDHVHILATDPDALTRWFADVLEAELVPEPPRVIVNVGGQRLFVNPVPEGVLKAPSPWPRKGVDHLALMVADLDAAVEGFRAKGVTFAAEPKQLTPTVRGCFLQAPEGVVVEVLERSARG